MEVIELADGYTSTGAYVYRTNSTSAQKLSNKLLYEVGMVDNVLHRHHDYITRHSMCTEVYNFHGTEYRPLDVTTFIGLALLLCGGLFVSTIYFLAFEF